MAINVNQAFAGQSIRGSAAAAESAGGARSSPRKSAEPSTPTDLPEASKPGSASVQEGAAAAAAVAAQAPPSAEELARAVEEANQLSESALRATNRTVKFGTDEGTGRVIITIREEVDGKETSRQLPPEALLRLVERLREAQDGGSLATGGLVDFKL